MFFCILLEQEVDVCVSHLFLHVTNQNDGTIIIEKCYEIMWNSMFRFIELSDLSRYSENVSDLLTNPVIIVSSHPYLLFTTPCIFLWSQKGQHDNFDKRKATMSGLTVGLWDIESVPFCPCVKKTLKNSIQIYFH